jgi:nucleotide-binding universal stress UspA family protein
MSSSATNGSVKLSVANVPSGNVLCATDFSPSATHAAHSALALAKAFGGRLELLHVVPVPQLASALTSTTVMGMLRDAAERELDRKVDALSGRGVEVTGRLEMGVVEDVVLERLAEAGFRLLVLGNHSREGLKGFLGSVTERLLARARIPVLVVPETMPALRMWLPERRALRITAGVDASLATEGVASALQLLAKATACDVDLVHLYWPPRENARGGAGWRTAEAGADPWVEAMLDREVRARLGHRLDAPDQPARIRLVPNLGSQPLPLLAQARAHAADLVVVGFGRAPAGAMARSLVRAAELPVLCVPAPDRVEAALHRVLAPARSALVPLDFSPLACEALPLACSLLRGGGTLVLAHVADPGPLGAVAPEVRAQLEADLREYVPDEAHGPGMAVHCVVHEATNSAQGILELAQRLGVDLIVMATRGRGGWERLVPGAVAEAVMRQASVPVVLVPPGARPG